MNTFPPSTLRLAAFRYLNSLPLLAGLLDASGVPHPDAPPVRWGTPADCARWLADGLVDVALIPSIEYARGEDLRFVPGIAISTSHRIRSVVVLSRRPLEDCASIALDASSRTSVALLRILLARRFHAQPRLEVMPPDPPSMLARHDAALLIADTALVAPTQGLRVYDLAAEWHAMTGLPFVFALWALPGRVAARIQPGDLDFLHGSASRGLGDLEGIARREAPRLGMSPDDCLAYLRDNLRFHLGDPERAGLERFFSLAAAEELAPAGVSLRSLRPHPGAPTGTVRAMGIRP